MFMFILRLIATPFLIEKCENKKGNYIRTQKSKIDCFTSFRLTFDILLTKKFYGILTKFIIWQNTVSSKRLLFEDIDEKRKAETV